MNSGPNPSSTKGSMASRKLRQLLYSALEGATLSFFDQTHVSVPKAELRRKLRTFGDQWYLGRFNGKGAEMLLNPISREELEKPERCSGDFFYGRFLIQMNTDPGAVAHKIFKCLKSGGKVLLEVRGQGSFSSFPYSSAFNRFLDLEKKLEKTRKSISGNEWVEIFREAGFSGVHIQHTLPVFLEGKHKLIPSLTFESIMDELLAENLAAPIELSALLEELRSFEQKGYSMISMPGIYQLSAYRP